MSILAEALGLFVSFAREVRGYALALLNFIIYCALQTQTVSRVIGKGWEKDGREAGFQRCVEGRDPPMWTARLNTHRSIPPTAVKAVSSYPAVACTRTGRRRPSYSFVSGDYRCVLPKNSASHLYR